MTSVSPAARRVPVPEHVNRSLPAEGWILAGVVDGVDALPRPLDDVAGMPYVLRVACDLALAGVRRIYVVWTPGSHPFPDLEALAQDPRLAQRATLTVVREPPTGDDDDGVVIARGDRIYHRDVPARAIAAWRSSPRRLAKLAGDSHDAIVVTDRRMAQVIVARTPRFGGHAAELARLAVAREIASAPPPYLAFTTHVVDPASQRLGERQLVWSLRKAADGLAARWINRHVSLPISWLLARTRVLPNQVTLAALVCALVGGAVIATGGYAAGVAGMLLVELGSIIDGVDGELARLRFQMSRRGQWLDTVVDDIANVAYVSGVIASLTASGASWALPLGAVALVAFAITQSTQYLLISTVYRSGDLAAIPWAFQSTEQLSRRGTGVLSTIRVNLPKLFKRDAVVTFGLIAALLGQLEVILGMFVGGALVFFAAFWVQYVRNRGAVAAARQRLRC